MSLYISRAQHSMTFIQQENSFTQHLYLSKSTKLFNIILFTAPLITSSIDKYSANTLVN